MNLADNLRQAAMLRHQAAHPAAASRSNSPYMLPAVADCNQPDDGNFLLPGSAAGAPALPLFKPATPATPPPCCDAAATPGALAPATAAAPSCSHSHASTCVVTPEQQHQQQHDHHHWAAAALLSGAGVPQGPVLPQPLMLDAGLLDPQQQQSSHSSADNPASGADTDADALSWQYSLVTCPWLFKPCPGCCRTHSGREVLMTYFDPCCPAARGLCNYCPDRAARTAAAAPGGLLQIRRSTYHEVVKAGDLGRMADVSGIQHYVINGAKVVFLRPRPQPRPPKGVAAPARCSVDGRQLMDGAARYCSLQCKLEGEDPSYPARHALAVARAHVVATQLGADLAAAAGAGAADASAAMAAAAAAAGGERAPAAAGGARGVPVTPVKRTTGIMRYEGAEDSGADEEDASDNQLAAGKAAGADTVPRWGARGKRHRAASAGVALAAAAVRGGAVHSHPAAAHDYAAGAHLLAAAAAAGGAAQKPAAAMAAVAPAAVMAPVVAASMGVDAVPRAASPASSGDSGRSSTFRWHAKRRKGEPARAPLQ